MISRVEPQAGYTDRMGKPGTVMPGFLSEHIGQE